MKQQFAVIGIGRFGYSLATTLYSMGHEVIAVDVDEGRIENIADEVTYAVQADATDDEALMSIGIQDVDVVIVAIASDIQASILAALNAIELGIQKVYAKAMNNKHSKVLYKVGVDKVFLPERDMGQRVAHYLVSKNIIELIELDNKHSIMEIQAFKNWHHKSLADLNFRAKYGVNVIAIKDALSLTISPLADAIIKPNDTLVVIGDNKSLDKLNVKE